MKWDDDAGYDRDDPKHPGYAEAVFDRADADRKRAREEGSCTCGITDNPDYAAIRARHGVETHSPYCPVGKREREERA